MSDADLARWVADRRSAEARERETLVCDPRFAIESALALIALSERLHGWPLREDPITRREDERARQTWKRLRSTLHAA